MSAHIPTVQLLTEAEHYTDILLKSYDVNWQSDLYTRHAQMPREYTALQSKPVGSHALTPVAGV